MNETQVKALLATLEAQRNSALNGLANSQAELALANEVIATLQKQVTELSDAAGKVTEAAKAVIEDAKQSSQAVAA